MNFLAKVIIFDGGFLYLVVIFIASIWMKIQINAKNAKIQKKNVNASECENWYCMEENKWSKI